MDLSLSKALRDIGCVKNGEFILKDGSTSQYYIDLRGVVSHPAVMKEIGRLINFWRNSYMIYCDSYCGIPYAGIPIALAASLHPHSSCKGIPMIYYRKEAKDYGTKKIIEGNYKDGDRIILIDDVITSGESKIEAAKVMEAHGLIVEAIIVVVDRSVNGKEMLKEAGYRLHSLMNIDELLSDCEHDWAMAKGTEKPFTPSHWQCEKCGISRQAFPREVDCWNWSHMDFNIPK